jgi:hypothetical protein
MECFVQSVQDGTEAVDDCGRIRVQCDCSRLYSCVFSGSVCVAACRKVRVLSEIWGCMCQCMYRSNASYSNIFYKWDIFPRYSNVCSSFLSVWPSWYLLLFRMYALCLASCFNIRNSCCCFWWSECVLYVWYWMFFLSVRFTLMGSLGISFYKCRYCCVYLFVCGALTCFALCFVCERILLFAFFNLCIRLTPLPQYEKLTHFVMSCLRSVCMFWFCGCASVFFD